MNLNRKTRSGLVSRQRHQIFMPRFQMTLILLLTGFAGFLSSFLLLNVGVARMWIRYPLAILAAYAAFLLLLRLWLALQNNYDSDLGVDLPFDTGSGGNVSPGAESFYGGGDFGGGGAGGCWCDGASDAAGNYAEGGGGSFSDTASDAASGFDLDIDPEGIVLLIAAVIALLGGIVATVYVIYIAPVFLGGNFS